MKLDNHTSCGITPHSLWPALAYAALLTYGLGWLVWLGTGLLPVRELPVGQFPPEILAAMRPEPRENITYLVTTLLAPLTALVGIWLASRMPRMTRCLTCCRGGIWLGFGVFMCAGSQFLPIYFDRTGGWWPIWLLGGGALAYGLSRGGGTARGIAWTVVGLAWILAVTLVLAARIYTLENLHLLFTHHLNIIAYALSQATAGAARIHQYGFYHYLLGPLSRWCGGGVFGISLVMGALYLAGAYWVFAALRRMAGGLWAAGWLVVFSLGANWAMLQEQLFDPYFAYYPIRFVWPALGLFLLVKTAGFGRIPAALWRGLAAGLAFWWNADSGIAVVGAGLFLELLNRIGRGARAGRPDIFLAALALVLAVGWCGFIGFGGVAAGWERMFGAGQAFYRHGFFMLPLPELPAPWGVVLLIYLGALVGGIYGIGVRRSGALFYQCAVYLGVLGLGLFLYYQGRSHLFNLVSVAWPAWALFFAAAGMTLRLRPRWQEQWLPVLALTAILAGLAAGVGRFDHLRWGVERFYSGVTRYAALSPMEENVRFMLEAVGSRRRANVFGYNQGIFLAETGLIAGVGDCGQEELVFWRNRPMLLQRLRESNDPLFISLGPGQPADFLRPVLPYYRLQGRSPNGSMLYFEPLPKVTNQRDNSSKRK